MSVLIVDDNERMRETIREVVQQLHPDIHQCADGASAVALYERMRPDWVLMDVAMDGMNGVEATRRIRAADPNARVVIVTDHDSAAYRHAAREAGACAFVPKADLTKLLDVIERNPERDV
ncbi:MAG: response regulator transcription factor [Gemmatimonadaceae bacterium]